MVQLSEKNGLVLTVTPFEVNLPWKGFLFCTLCTMHSVNSWRALDPLQQKARTRFDLQVSYFSLYCEEISILLRIQRAVTGPSITLLKRVVVYWNNLTQFYLELTIHYLIE